jgi:hypothetical protein
LLEDVPMRMPRLLALAIAPAVLTAGLSVPAGSAADALATCGPTIHIQDPDIRASFERFTLTQSPSASKICAFYRNDSDELKPSLASR